MQMLNYSKRLLMRREIQNPLLFETDPESFSPQQSTLDCLCSGFSYNIMIKSCLKPMSQGCYLGEFVVL
jgi:hypothetical protein